MTHATIPVFFHTSQTAQADELGMDFSIGDSRVRGVTFYAPVAVSVMREEVDGNAVFFGRIYANGTEFVTPLTQEHLEQCFSGNETEKNKALRERWLKKSDYKPVNV